MLRQIFIGLPVKDLARATDFFVGLGFTVEPMASDERSAGLVVNDGTMLMLNAEPYSREFTQREIVDPATAREVTLDLSADGRGTSSPVGAHRVGGVDRSVQMPVPGTRLG
jgi:predicted lactoylglutathione lyase